MDPKKLHEFLIQCELNFHDRPQAFCLDSWKEGFALSFLKGVALAWFEPDLLNTIPGAEPAWADDYSKFIIKLTANFGLHDPVSNAKHQLNNLSMKDGSCINKQSGSSSATTTSSPAGKRKNPQCPSSTPKSSNSSAPDLSGILGKDGKLTAMEHLCHMKNSLCLFCGLPGHSAKDCPRSMSCIAKAHAAQLLGSWV
ncbi:hypothetical protein ID866_11541 [Astraeus odoratus]|nr:hypothetical protein ID866_11541 [Astraeus odoratus]